jgi:hypothetical protein
LTDNYEGAFFRDAPCGHALKIFECACQKLFVASGVNVAKKVFGGGHSFCNFSISFRFNSHPVCLFFLASPFFQFHQVAGGVGRFKGVFITLAKEFQATSCDAFFCNRRKTLIHTPVFRMPFGALRFRLCIIRHPAGRLAMGGCRAHGARAAWHGLRWLTRRLSRSTRAKTCSRSQSRNFPEHIAN